MPFTVTLVIGVTTNGLLVKTREACAFPPVMSQPRVRVDIYSTTKGVDHCFSQLLNFSVFFMKGTPLSGDCYRRPASKRDVLMTALPPTCRENTTVAR